MWVLCFCGGLGSARGVDRGARGRKTEGGGSGGCSFFGSGFWFPLTFCVILVQLSQLNFGGIAPNAVPQ